MRGRLAGSAGDMLCVYWSHRTPNKTMIKAYFWMYTHHHRKEKAARVNLVWRPHHVNHAWCTDPDTWRCCSCPDVNICYAQQVCACGNITLSLNPQSLNWTIHTHNPHAGSQNWQQVHSKTSTAKNCWPGLILVRWTQSDKIPLSNRCQVVWWNGTRFKHFIARPLPQLVCQAWVTCTLSIVKSAQICEEKMFEIICS